MALARRDFVGRLTGAAAGATVLSPFWGRPATSSDTKSVLVETAHFDTPGGWVLDNQFELQLGFSYLLAHGLGKPVENARARVEFPAAGRYHVWVLTKNWRPGPWEAPGRFKIRLGGRELETTFGTDEGWGWQRGGAVSVEAERRPHELELKDLTGFEGRCSAIYFSLDPDDIPPFGNETLPQWRRRKLGLSFEPEERGAYDLVIAGGGISGCAAAIAADSQGLSVALIQNRPTLGGNASSEIRVHTEGIHGKAAPILEKIDTPHYPNGSAESIQANEKRMDAMLGLANVDIFLGHTVVSTETKDGRIESITAMESVSGALKRFRSPQFIDATGDGWLGYQAGADYRYGREPEDEFGEAWDKHGDLWAPEEPDNRVMGSSVMWYTKETNRRVRFPAVPWAMPVAKNHVATEGEWQWEFSDNDLNQIDDAEEIRDHMFCAIYGSYSNALKRPANANRELDWIAFVLGKRESRRLMGAHIFSGAEARDSIKFADTVVTEKRSIDVHYQRKLKGYPVDFISEALFLKPKDGFYYIPYRSLYSRNIANLQMAGRCFSCSHVGLGGPRVMNTCGQMGVATGFAAALCARYRVDPSVVGDAHIKELQELCGYTNTEV